MRSSGWILVSAVIVGCRVPDGAGDTRSSVAPEVSAAPVVTWGPERSGLRLRVEAPARVSRGDDLMCTLRVLVDRSAVPSPLTVDVRPPAYFSRLCLARVDGSDSVVIEPTDPDFGMPDPPLPPDEPADRSILDSSTATEGALGTVDFPLASQWDRVTPGRWRGVVRFSHDGAARRDRLAGSWRGTLSSQEFEFDVAAAPARWLDVRAPAALVGGDADVFVRLPVRNGFAVGLRWTELGDDGPGEEELGGRPHPGMFDGMLARIAASRAPVEFEIFETSFLPRHMWSPGPRIGHYRSLWSDSRSVGGERSRGQEEMPTPRHLREWRGLFVRDGGRIVSASEADIAVAKSYARSRSRGPLAANGERLTILAAKTTYAAGEEIRVIHAHEATRAGIDMYVMGPKEVFGETVNGRATTQPSFIEGTYDGEVVPAPAVDYNYEITSYRLPPGRHVIRWSQRTMSSDLVLTSNELEIEVR